MGSETGFTLVELVVLVAVIALWALMLAPALAKTRPDVKAIQCRANLKRLMAAWQMYSDDNQGRLVPNREGPSAGRLLEKQSWVAGWLGFGSYSADNTNVNLLVNSDLCQGYGALLGPYVKSPSVFWCPADRALVAEASGQVPRVRSISMNNWVGEGARKWNSGSQFQIYEKCSQINKPSPADLWILLDEHEQSINDGTFFSDPDVAWQLIDYPASYHAGACGLSFADGHSEIHKWLDSRTMPPFDPSRNLVLNVNLPNDMDVLWLQQHATSLP